MKGCALDSINQELYAAIKCRTRWISRAFVWRHSPSMREKKLQPIQRVAIILATRFHPFPGEECGDSELLSWYMIFCDEIELALKAMQAAIASGELVARSSMSRMPVEPTTWLQTDISASMRASFANLLNDGPPTDGWCASPHDRPWPDESGKPDVFHLAVDERELIEWLAAKRIATMSEAESLFSSDGSANDDGSSTQAAGAHGEEYEGWASASSFQPKTSVGKIAVEVAWRIEQGTGRKADAASVMEELNRMASNGDRPDILIEPGGRYVWWLTSKETKKRYTLEACVKTLQSWNAGRE